MLRKLASALHDFSHLFFPHNCLGCGNDILQNDALLCAKCFEEMPETGFIPQPGNPVEKIFYGRIQTEHAGSAFYFTKGSLMQQLLIELKYRRNKEAGFYLGKLLGMELAASGRFDMVDAIIPLPLNPKKEKKRGYNQALVIAEGINKEWGKPIIKHAVARKLFTDTQTKKGRVERLQNMEDVFIVKDTPALENKHILLVDDVVTTGASLEACATPMLKIPGTKISIATVAYTI